jgi:hypothetical protein
VCVRRGRGGGGGGSGSREGASAHAHRPMAAVVRIRAQPKLKDKADKLHKDLKLSDKRWWCGRAPAAPHPCDNAPVQGAAALAAARWALARPRTVGVGMVGSAGG